MRLDQLQHLAVHRQMMNPNPKQWRLALGLAFLLALATYCLT
jgi:hypothetical protein